MARVSVSVNQWRRWLPHVVSRLTEHHHPAVLTPSWVPPLWVTDHCHRLTFVCCSSCCLGGGGGAASSCHLTTLTTFFSLYCDNLTSLRNMSSLKTNLQLKRLVLDSLQVDLTVELSMSVVCENVTVPELVTACLKRQLWQRLIADWTSCPKDDLPKHAEMEFAVKEISSREFQ